MTNGPMEKQTYGQTDGQTLSRLAIFNNKERERKGKKKENKSI